MRNNNQPGYILVLTLTVVSIVVLIASQIFYTGSGFSAFCHTATAREQAKTLAMSGIPIVCAQLHVPASKKQKAPAKPSERTDAPRSAEPESDVGVKLLKKTLPLINRWQQVRITMPDGTQGTVQLYVACEDGKLLLNGLLTSLGNERVDKTVKQCIRQLLGTLARSVGSRQDLAANLYGFFKHRKGVWFNDVTELITVPGFHIFDDRIYVTLPNEQKNKIQTVYLTDIFTSRAGFGTLNPWVLSASLRTMLGLRPASQHITGEELETMLKGFKPSFNWEADWDKTLKSFYGKDLKSLPKGIDKMFSTRCEPYFFSVLACATVAGITQRVYAILVREERRDESVVFTPMKVYLV